MAKKNSGKIFEDNFRESIPKNVYYYRFRDTASTYYGGNNFLRFSNTNIADCLLFNGNKLLLCELKAHKGSSIPLDCIIGKKSKQKQIEDLYNASQYENVYCYLIVFFEDKELCYALPIRNFIEFIEDSTRKSVPIDYFEQNAYKVDVIKLRTNFRFNLDVITKKED